MLAIYMRLPRVYNIYPSYALQRNQTIDAQPLARVSPKPYAFFSLSCPLRLTGSLSEPATPLSLVSDTVTPANSFSRPLRILGNCKSPCESDAIVAEFDACGSSAVSFADPSSLVLGVGAVEDPFAVL